MEPQLINNGAFDNDPNADNLRTGAEKINDNFEELYASVEKTGRIINLGYTFIENPSISDVVAKMNSRTTEILVTDVPVLLTFIVAYAIDFEITPAKTYTYMFRPGTGKYGIGGIPVTPAMIALLSVRGQMPEDIENDPNATIIPLDPVVDGDFIAKANEDQYNWGDSGTITDDGVKQYYFTFTKDGALNFAFFKGVPDIYGDGAEPFTEDMFVITTNSKVVPDFKIIDTVSTVGDLQNYEGTATTLIVKDLYRGGTFNYFSSGLTDDDGIVFNATGKGVGYWQREYSGPVNVKWFGALGLGLSDDTAAVQKALNAMPDEGGKLYSSWGKYLIEAGGLTTDKQILFIGDGVPSLGLKTDPAGYEFLHKGTVFISKSATTDLLTCNAYGCSFRDMAFWNEAVTTPTAGTGINLPTAGSFIMDNVSVKGFWNCMNIELATRWYMTSTNIFYPVNYGIAISNGDNPLLADTGDSNIIGMNIMTNNNTCTGIKWESSGGVKISGLKINPVDGTRLYRGLEITGVANTSILLITNSSIEGWNDSAIYIKPETGVSFGQIIINGNQIAPYHSGITGNGIYIEDCDIVSITGNTFNDAANANTNAAIKLKGCNIITVDPNTYGHWENDVEFDTCTQYNRPILENGIQTITGQTSFRDGSNFYSMTVGSAGGNRLVAIGNIGNRPQIQAFEADFATPTDIYLCDLGGNPIIPDGIAADHAASVGQLPKIINHTENITFASVGSHASDDQVFTLTGVVVGDTVDIYPPAALDFPKAFYRAIATDDDEVTARVTNTDTPSITMSAGNFKFRIIKS